MKIVTYNINGVKARLDNLLQWLKEEQPDVVCLQEIKCEDAAFPSSPIEDLGYNVAVHGMKGFHGVAILSKSPMDEVMPRLIGDDADAQSRYLETVISTGWGAVRVVSLYLPNGNPVGTDKFSYKLAWMRRLIARARELLMLEEAFILAGDYNIIPMPIDARHPERWVDDALFRPESRACYRELVNLGLTDGFRACAPDAGHYTFWDYQAGAFQKNNGIRIDHLLLSPQALDRLTGAGIDKHVRAWERPSDHVPTWITLRD
ncbi:exodeoxyribonuclease-3 [Rhodoligotrophos appendicifer]|uniref:exodeoxyribonuclease III n=1 Tax=Rhodoligotrophos appendicifer TaxID=987056 RepID=UPI0011864EF6|nr:exodeoxyribonuclease III [Rhodoligotrophos appendicifer]